MLRANRLALIASDGAIAATSLCSHVDHAVHIPILIVGHEQFALRADRNPGRAAPRAAALLARAISEAGQERLIAHGLAVLDADHLDLAIARRGRRIPRAMVGDEQVALVGGGELR